MVDQEARGVVQPRVAPQPHSLKVRAVLQELAHSVVFVLVLLVEDEADRVKVCDPRGYSTVGVGVVVVARGLREFETFRESDVEFCEGWRRGQGEGCHDAL